MLYSLLTIATQVAMQVDSKQGTAAAQKGAVQRLSEPTYYDFMFPALAFLLVICLPASVALWVIFKTATEKKAEPDET